MSTIVAAVTTVRDLVSGNVIIIIARDEDEREKLAVHMANILKASVHDLGNGTYLLVQH